MTDRQPTPGVHENFASNLMDQAEPCPICDKLFRPDDLCATDIELGICHAACLEGSPVVDLDTGNELPDGKVATYSYGDVAQEREECFRLLAKHYMDALIEIATEDDLERAHEVACKALGSTPAPQSHVQVKPLLWMELGVPKHEAYARVERYWTTNPPQYAITLMHGQHFVWKPSGVWRPALDGPDFGRANNLERVSINNTLEAAKEAAQQDHKRTIVSALVPPSPQPNLLVWKAGSVSRRSIAEADGRPMYEVGLDKGEWYWMHNWRGLHKEHAASEDEAKAAAQKDFASRQPPQTIEDRS